jgi:hypothetical protein
LAFIFFITGKKTKGNQGQCSQLLLHTGELMGTQFKGKFQMTAGQCQGGRIKMHLKIL